MRSKLSVILNGVNNFLPLLLLPVCLAACATNPVSGDMDLVFMSENQELEMGKAWHPQILKQHGGEYDDPKIRKYVNDLGNQLAEKSHRDHLIYHFTVLNSPMINAFALPGGYVYVTRGIMAYMGSEAELAGVIGHEIGHITARHGVRQHAKSTFAQMLLNVAARATNNPYVDDLAAVFAVAIIRGYGRNLELEADRLGAEYVARIGMDPQKMLEMLGTLKDHDEFEVQQAKEQNRRPNVYHGLFATHPKVDDRLKALIDDALKFKNNESSAEDPEVFLRKLEGVAFGPSSEEGVVKGASFYHRDLKIALKFPEGWSIDNKPSHVLARNTSDTSHIVFTVEDRNRKETPKQFLARKLGEKHLDGTSLPGEIFDSYTTVTKFNTPYGLREGRIAVAFSAKKAYIFHAASRTEKEFASNDIVFIETMNSLRQLRDDEYDLTKPLMISLVRVKPQDTFASLAKQSGFSDHAEEQLRILNGMYPDGELRVGQLIKTVR